MTDIAIRMTGLSKSYGDKAALGDLDLTIGSGEVFGLLGHNGAGKTTTVNLLTTLLTPTSGRVEVGGVDIATDPNRVRRMIGYLPENVHFYDNLSTMENLWFFGRLSGLSKPDARIHEVLFLDEPTSGLDPEGVRQLRDVIVRLNRGLGMTIFMNTHLLSEVTKSCTSIGILRRGELAYHNSLEATLSGDLFAEKFNLGYFVSFLIFGALIAIITVAHFRFKLDAVLAFWLARILTRPLDASLGDLLSQKHKHGSLALGTTGTSAIFLGMILALVIYLTVTRKDATERRLEPAASFAD